MPQLFHVEQFELAVQVEASRGKAQNVPRGTFLRE
jgi:hypothetical protein